MGPFWKGFWMGILASILTAIAGAYGLYKYGEYLVGKRIKPPVVPAQLRESYDFRYSTLAGAAKRVSDLKGKVVFVNFWGTWCIPCVGRCPPSRSCMIGIRMIQAWRVCAALPLG